jgi:hypothetical protein
MSDTANPFRCDKSLTGRHIFGHWVGMKLARCYNCDKRIHRVGKSTWWQLFKPRVSRLRGAGET